MTNDYASGLDPELANAGPTHRTPTPYEAGGDGTMPCCGATPYGVPRWHRMTNDDALVTCGKQEAGK